VPRAGRDAASRDLVTTAGRRGIPVRVDHTIEREVAKRPHWGRYFAEHVRVMPSGPPGTAMRWTLERAREAAPA
jgi:hypothetical protein